jgi:DNA-binding FadR family transcriptional regulator
MFDTLEPIKADSLKEVFIRRFEKLILSGEVRIGQRLPSERDLAARLGVSRPVVHEGLMELAARGLVSMKPRVGTVVSDFRREGSITLLTSLIEYGEGRLDRRMLDSILQMRLLMEVEFARLAALNRSDDHVRELGEIVGMEGAADPRRLDDIIALDFRFHLVIALATGNMIYPLMMNSFRKVYTNFTGQFFSDPLVIGAVHAFHARLAGAIKKGDPEEAVAAMTEMLRHGEEYLRRFIAQSR